MPIILFTCNLSQTIMTRFFNDLLNASVVFTIIFLVSRYQHSNNGNFPSLNLTHKEVGGSFYTVREIVRDIIQENRVLGPAKFILEELNTDHFFEQNPLGSIARDPEPFLDAPSIENQCEPDKLQDTNKKMISVSDGSYTEVVHQVVDNGHVISVGHIDVANKEPIEAVVDGGDTRAEHLIVDQGHTMNVTNNESVETAVVSDESWTGNEYKVALNDSQVNIVNKKSNETAIPEMQVSDPSALKQKVEPELAAAKTPMTKVNVAAEDLIVETFPLSSASMTADGIRSPGGLRDSSNSPENDMKMLELRQGELNCIEPSKNSNLLDDKFEDAPANQILKNTSNTGLEKEDNVRDISEESSNHSISTHKEHYDFEDRTDSQVGVSHKNTITIDQSKKADGVKVFLNLSHLLHLVAFGYLVFCLFVGGVCSVYNFGKIVFCRQKIGYSLVCQFCVLFHLSATRLIGFRILWKD